MTTTLKIYLRMLIKDFYKINNLTSDESEVIARIKLNPNHEVYKGHFPGQAVVPGVIQLQIVKEILENHLSKNLFMDNITQVKYLVPITPEEVPELHISISYKNDDKGNLKSNVLISFEETMYTKARIIFTLEN